MSVTATEGDDNPANNTDTEITRVRDIAFDIARAMIEDESWLAGASFDTIPPLGNPNMVGTSALGGFPRHGPTHGILTSGDAELADDPNNSTGSGAGIGGSNVRGDSDFDVTVLKVDLNVPAEMNCVSVNFRFLSEEFPEFVGQDFNDAFIAEVGSSTWTTSGSTITAPDNFAFDPANNPISINAAGFTGMTSAQAAGTTYDGATPLLSASQEIGTGARSIYLSIFDQGDGVFDSAVQLDRLRLSNVPPESCNPGATLLSATKTADAPKTASGGTNGYTISIANPHSAPLTLSSITDDLPLGFGYVAGSTTGATNADPTISDHRLTWNGPFTLPAGGTLTLHFGVRVATVPGTYLNNAGATGQDVSVTPSGPTAPITVLPAIFINDVTVTEGNSGTTNATFTVSLNGEGADPVTVDFVTADGTAVAPGDYTALTTGTLTFAPGEISKPVTVVVNGDATFEASETFFVNLSNPSEATIADAQGIGTITNDDPAPAFSINDVTQNEGNSGTTEFTFTVSKTATPTELSATVNVATANGTATASGDYTAITQTLTFAPSETSKTVTVLVNGDLVFEEDETFAVGLSGATNATISDAIGLGTIVNDDTQPAFSIDNVTQNEGNTGTTPFVFTVTKTGATQLPASVDFATADGTAVAPDDYTALSTTRLDFAAGEASKTITVLVNGDTDFEPNETFLVNLANASGATITDNQGVGTITNEDAAPALLLSINDATVAEGNSGTTTATFTVTLNTASSEQVTVDYVTADGTATAGEDYVSATGTVTFTPGDTSETIAVTVNGDMTFEPTETFTVNLSNAAGAGISDGSGLGTITNDDTQPAFTIDDVTQNEGSSGTTEFVFTVTKVGATAFTSTVDFATADGTARAAAPSDYTAITTQTLTFAPGDATKQITVLVNGDTTFEANETFFVNLSNASGATISDNQGVGTITNDDDPPAFSINNVTQNEGDTGTTEFIFTVTKTGATEVPASVDFATADGTATAPDDYTTRTTTALPFAAGEGAKTITVLVNGDATVEADETFLVNLSNASGATISDNQGVGTITNDDAAPARLLSIDDATVAEGNSGTTTATFTVTMSSASSEQVTVDFATANGTATAGEDYVAATGTVTFTPGDTSETIAVTVNGDTTFESDETFNVTLTNPVGAGISDGTGLGTITNDDAQPAFSIDDVTHNEGNSGTTEFAFTVTKTGATALASTVDFVTADGTATAPGDYTALTTQTLTFAPGDATKQVTVLVNGDTTFEPDETFFVNLSNPTAATVTDSQGVGTITNDDAPPAFSIDDVSMNEGNTGTTAFVFTVTKTGATQLPASVDFVTADETATAPGDYAARTTSALTFAPGEASKTITVLVNGDTTFEADETFFVDLSNATGATITDNQGIGTITNDDAQPAFSIGNVAMNEGNTGTTEFIFTVTKTGSTALSASVDVVTANGAAVAPGDYTALLATTLTFAPGETSKTVTVLVNGDTTFEANENFFVNLSNATGATIADGQAIGTITNDDAAPTIAIDDVTMNEGNSGTTSFNFTVTKSGSTAVSASVSLATANGTAIAPGDYTALPAQSLSFGPDETSKTITVLVNGDTTFEPNESFFVNLSTPANATIADSQGVGTITNDDAAGAVSISIGDATVAEGNSATTNAVFTVSLSAASSETVTVVATTADGTAVAPGDYVNPGPITLTFAPGETEKTIPVPVNGDLVFEANETFTVELSAPTNASIEDGSGLGTIVNDDNPPSFSIDDVSKDEGNSGTTSFTFTVTKTGLTAFSASVNFATSDGTAIAPSDYTAQLSTTLTFAPGETSKAIDVLVNGDVVFEQDETFTVVLSGATSASISDGTGLGTIENDDDAPTLAIDDVSKDEGNSGTTSFIFTVTKTGLTALPATVDFATADGTATAPGDYAALTTTMLTFAPGETEKTITVLVNGDTVLEPTETFFVNLSNASAATITDNQGTGTIVNDDGMPTFSINDVSTNEGNSGTTAFVFTVTKTGSTALPATVEVATADGTATAPGDYTTLSPATLTFAPGEASKQVTVLVNGDTILEGNETFFVDLSNASGATITDDRGVGTITNDDATPTFSINDVSANEGDSGTTELAFTVTKTGLTAFTTTVDYATANGTAVAPGDYTALPTDTLTFAPGDTTKTVTVLVNGDGIVEPTETFSVNLSNASGATIADGQGIGTIVNDDAAPAFVSPTPACGSTVTGRVGVALTFTVRASDADTGDTVTLTAAGVPTGATLNPPLPASGNPVETVFTWTPASPGTTVVTFTATDNHGNATLCALTLVVSEEQQGAVLLVIGGDSIDEGTSGKSKRTELQDFAENHGDSVTLETGQTGDEGWYAPTCIPESWLGNGGNTCLTGSDREAAIDNYFGTGTGVPSQSRLDKVPGVMPLRALGVNRLLGQQVCAVVNAGDVSVNYGGSLFTEANLQGETRGVVAFRVDAVTTRRGKLPNVRITILETDVCSDWRLLNAPVPKSSSVPNDRIPPGSPSGYRQPFTWPGEDLFF